jgi:purine-binding chemotaxis protein CheW
MCALPLEFVEETMRPMPVEPLPGVPGFIIGVSVVRGAAVPVVDAALLLGGVTSSATRFVTVKAGPRRIALAVDLVVGVMTIRTGGLSELPPLFRETDAVSALGTLDSELMLVLHSTRLVPDTVWTTIDAHAGR